MSRPPCNGSLLAARIKAFLRYFAAAAAALVVDWCIWLVLWHVTGHPVAAQGISRAAGGVAAFCLMRTMAFRATDESASGQAKRFTIAWGASWILSVVLVRSLSAAVTPPSAKIAADGITFIANYAVARMWVFRVPVGNPNPQSSEDTRATSTII